MAAWEFVGIPQYGEVSKEQKVMYEIPSLTRSLAVKRNVVGLCVGKATQHAIHSVVNHDLTPARAMAPDEPPISAPAALPTILMPCAIPPSSSSVPIVVIVFFDCCISNSNEPPPPPPPLLLRCPQSCRHHF